MFLMSKLNLETPDSIHQDFFLRKARLLISKLMNNQSVEYFIHIY